MNAICKLSDGAGGDGGQWSKDGALHQFAMDNHIASRQQCGDTAEQAFKEAKAAILDTKNSQPETDLNDIVGAAEQAYYERAKGPAKDEIYLQWRQEIEDTCKDVADNTPGKPLDLCCEGTSKNKIKLRWRGTVCKGSMQYEV